MGHPCAEISHIAGAIIQIGLPATLVALDIDAQRVYARFMLIHRRMNAAMSQYTSEPPIVSPCVRNCCLDEHDICMGCRRSVEEIIAWGSASNDERRTILERATQRAQEARARRNRWDLWQR